MSNIPVKNTPDCVSAALVEAIKTAKATLKDGNRNTYTIKIEYWEHSSGRANGKPINPRDLILFADKQVLYDNQSKTNVRNFTAIAERVAQKESSALTPVMCKVVGSLFDRQVERIIVAVKTCKEFAALNRTLSRHSGKTLDPFQLYNVRLTGKRGRYGESGQPEYGMHNAEACAEALSWIRKHKTAADKLSWVVADYDDIDTEYSIKYETECYGVRHKELNITLTTPKGKVKAQTFTF